MKPCGSRFRLKVVMHPTRRWEDAEFMKEVASSGVYVHLAEGEYACSDANLLPHSELLPVLRKLRMDY